MALNAFMSVVGEKIGNITGNAREGGNFGKIVVMGYEHEVADEPGKDGYSHRPFVIFKQIDPATPLLHGAHALNDTLDCNLFCNRVPAAGGVSENHFTVTLANAKILYIRTHMENNRFTDKANLPIMEEVAFVYESINWSYKAKDGTGGAGVVQAIPVPEKLDEWAQGILTDAFKKHTDMLMDEIKSQSKAMYQELLGEKKPK